MDLKTKGDKHESCTATSIQTGIQVGVSKTQRPTLAWKVGFSASLEPPGIKVSLCPEIRNPGCTGFLEVRAAGSGFVSVMKPNASPCQLD